MVAGYLLANGGGPSFGLSLLIGNNGVLPTIGGFLLNLLTGAQDTGRSASSRQAKTKPKVWESWDRHREWQYADADGRDGQDGNVQEVIKNILGGAGRAVQQSSWWEAARGAAEDFGRTAQANVAREGEKQEERKAKSRSKRSKRSQGQSQ